MIEIKTVLEAEIGTGARYLANRFLSISLDAIPDARERFVTIGPKIVAKTRGHAICRRFRARPTFFDDDRDASRRGQMIAPPNHVLEVLRNIRQESGCAIRSSGRGRSSAHVGAGEQR